MSQTPPPQTGASAAAGTVISAALEPLANGATKSNFAEQVQLYNAYLDDLGRIGSHHTQTRAFYVSIISVLLVFLSSSGSEKALLSIPLQGQLVISLLGIILCLAWFSHTLLFDSLYNVKFDNLRKMEKAFTFPYHIFEEEEKMLFPKKHALEGKNKYSWFTKIESIVALLVGVPFLIILIIVLFNIFAPHTHIIRDYF